MIQKNTKLKKTSTEPLKKASAKVVKKSAVKKVTKKKPVAKKRIATSVKVTQAQNKRVHKKSLKVASEEKKFWAQNGEIIDSLANLANSFAMMDTLVYQHHVNEFKNDFAQWVEHVLEDSACAEALRRTHNPQSAQVVVLRHLKQYDI
ncbi:MAG: DUF5752 family protein [Candidatus Paceibacteria bacterium]